MRYDPFLAERRFGYGRNADVPAPTGVADMLRLLQAPDRARTAYPLPDFTHLRRNLVSRRRFRSYALEHPDTAEGKEARKKSDAIMQDMWRQHAQWFGQIQARRVTTRDGFREKLVAFWANHFTAMGKGGVLRVGGPLYMEEAVRPHVAGRFADLLIACVTHPLMLHYLDQNSSAGPNSRTASRQPRMRGLNENLAREVLELHTLGVDGPYGQDDVHQLAKLLTGLSTTRDYGFKFRSSMVEPGSETVLGRTYEDKASVQMIRDALRDIALRPETAAHIARKLVVHFVSDAPPDGLVSHVAQAYRDTQGDLMACYRAMLEHPGSWDGTARNIRPPEEFMAAGLRALNVEGAVLAGLERKETKRLFFDPLRRMGQPWLRPGGPDGFAEEDAAWVTPQGIAARMEWAMNAPARLRDDLPDPRVFVSDALGEVIPPAVAFAAKNAASRAEAIGLILCSPAFQRR